MAKQDLDRSKVAGGLVDHGSPRSPQGMRTVILPTKPDRRHPLIDQPGVLPSAEMISVVDATGKGIVIDCSSPSLMRAQMEATRAGMGVSALPCFLGDADPSLVRVPGSPVTHIGDIWLLTHADTRRTKRVRLLCDRVRGAMQGYAGRLAGRLDSGASEFR